MRRRIQQSLNAELSGLRTSDAQRERLYRSAIGRYRVRRRLTAGWVLALALMLLAVGAVAAVLLTHAEIIERFAVPMALENDAGAVNESYSHEELAEIIAVLSENGITLEEDTQIMRALESGQGYWEEETLMAICREAFGGIFYTWSIEEKHWFETMTVRIGFKEKNPYRIPGEGDMTIPEAKAHAAALLRDAYGVALPVESDETWDLVEWFYESWTDEDGVHPEAWRFEYENKATHVTEYEVSFDRAGGLLEIDESSFHGEVSAFASFWEADDYFSNKYGAVSAWPLEAWAEFGQAIAEMEPENAGQWCYIHAGYCLPPDGAISGKQAVALAREEVALPGEPDPLVICCTDQGAPIYKVRLSYNFPGHEISAAYDAIWCLELDCMTGEILDRWEYTYGPGSKPIRMYVPFSVQESAPAFE